MVLIFFIVTYSVFKIEIVFSKISKLKTRYLKLETQASKLDSQKHCMEDQVLSQDCRITFVTWKAKTDTNGFPLNG